VATYIDGVYISRPSQGLTDLLDLQRVEVLRGPQGTLFGRNTTGGAINILTKDPGDTFGGLVTAAVGNFDSRAASATLNVPISDRLAGRLSYSYRERDGYGHNRSLDRDVWDLTSHFVRGKLKYTGESIHITLGGDYNRQENSGQLVQLSAINAPLFGGKLAAFLPALTASLHNSAAWWDTYGGGLVTPATVGTLDSGAQAYYRKLPFNTLEAWGFGGTINIDLGRLNLKSITGYRYAHSAALVDTDGSPAPVLATFAGSVSRAVSEEIQLSGNIFEDLSFIAGGYYGDETGTEYSRSQLFGGLLRNSIADVENRTKGLFAQFYYQITPAVRAVGGYRHTWDNRDSVLHNGQVFGLPYNAVVAGSPTGINCTVSAPDAPPTATSCNQTQTAKFNYPAWTGGLDWQAMDDLFVYVKTSGAAKAGGWNLRAGGLPAFAPEKVRDIEAGFKSDFLNRRLRTNVAVFNIWKTNNQALVNAVVPGIGVTQYIQNNGEARIWGAEFEVTAAPWTGMQINANLSLQDGKYGKGTYKETQRVPSATALAGCTTGSPTAQLCAVDLSDLPLIQLPKTQFNIGATQRSPVAAGTLSVHGDYAYISSQQFNAVKPAAQQSAAVKAQYAIENALGRIRAYGVFNARIAYELENPDLELAFVVRNIADKKYLLRSFSDLYRQLGIGVEYAGEPRVFGFEAKYKF
jgi:iron complex outermembrane receptor protein